MIPGSFIVSGILYSVEKHVKDFITKNIDEVHELRPRGSVHMNHRPVVCHGLRPHINISASMKDMEIL